ncbi:MAG: NADH-quinone oxidoreductase subunit L [Clostridia bacterium]|nr:NADH-quinone oxidoreductase subunit L [Clostridia bacterium]
MDYLIFLILFPLLAAAVLVFTKNNTVRKIVVYASAILIMCASVAFVVWNHTMMDGLETKYLWTGHETHIIDKIMLGIEILLMVIIVIMGIRRKKFLAPFLSVVGTGLMTWFELSGLASIETNNLYSDQLTLVMVLLVGIIGPLICIYAVGYMEDYHKHHTEFKDRRTFFFPMLFVFLSAMFGLITSANLLWLYFFWEVTSVASFLLIGYTRTQEAVNNSFRALWMNLLGGLAFAAAIIYSVTQLNVITLQQLVTHINADLLLIPITLLAFAALTKSAQLPFSKWLLGAMVAPTPTSALLHSATMVKAGVYLLLRIAPAMHGTHAGMMVALVGGFTFFIASLFAVTVSDGKKVLAYSTISNLGLITACAGVGTEETVWAAILLLMFHAVSKSMMFQAVGAIENATGSRDIEDMHGLIMASPFLALVMVIGIAGMFLAPFGMLISKWAALKAFVDAHNIFLILSIAFGSATTMLYWTKWLTKILACKALSHKVHHKTAPGIWTSLLVHATIMVALCVLLPILSRSVVEPVLIQLYRVGHTTVLAPEDLIIVVVMVIMIFVVPFIAAFIVRRMKVQPSLEYMSGINTGDNRTFRDSFGNIRYNFLSNWYLVDYFSEKKLWKIAVAVSVGIIVVCAGLVIGTMSGGVTIL